MICSISPKIIVVSVFFSAISLTSCSRVDDSNSKLQVLAPSYEPVSIPSSQGLCSNTILNSLKQADVFNFGLKN